MNLDRVVEKCGLELDLAEHGILEPSRVMETVKASDICPVLQAFGDQAG
jgi:hypothetical protein